MGSIVGTSEVSSERIEMHCKKGLGDITAGDANLFYSVASGF